MKTLSIYFLLFSFLLFSSCSNDDNFIPEPEPEPIAEPEPEPEPEPDPIPAADIIGTVDLFDDDQSMVDNSGMSVSIEGSDPLITTTTDLNGNYSLKDVPFGTYNLVFEKEGFGIHKIFNIEHKDEGEFTLMANVLKLGQISNSMITATSVRIEGNFIILNISRPMTENLLVKRIRIFYHKSDDVSNEVYTQFSPIIGTTGNPANLTFSISFFRSLGFESGETLWFKVYGDNFYSNSYEDPDLGRTVFPNVNTNTVDAISVVIP
ncbi:carboxypeptidase-like regulatory domain-containing protein [Aquimarina algiphila]|uniref:carboxypeptidase-like regulatory domain-containing protein n=1 Tax=Aquimarina algiphila TaxID=2047982 RepID=UPI002491ACB5|nr:carboxypeptidase-like regulatory domain-containing protein [Aquimarina algiphila]